MSIAGKQKTESKRTPNLVMKRSDLESALHDFKELQALGGARVEVESDEKSVTSQTSRREIERLGGRFPLQGSVFSVLMCKGGVGKTTTVYFTAQRLAAYGARVLLIDADPQSNLTEAWDLEKRGFEIDEETPVLLDIVEKRCVAEEAIIEIEPNLHLIPSTPMNSNLDAKIRDLYKNPSIAFKRWVDLLKPNYDFIIFDCAPALNLTNTAVIAASDSVILPVSPDRFSQMGLKLTMSEIQQIEEDFQINLRKRILVTRFDSREYTSQRYLAELHKSFATQMMPIMIRASTEVKNAVARGDNLFSSSSRAGADYDQLSKYLMAELLLKARGKSLKEWNTRSN